MKPRKRRRRKGEIEPPTEAEIKLMEKQKRAKVALATIGIHEAPTKVEWNRCGVCRMQFKQIFDGVQFQHQYFGPGVQFCPFIDHPEIVIDYKKKKNDMTKARY